MGEILGDDDGVPPGDLVDDFVAPEPGRCQHPGDGLLRGRDQFRDLP
jgi:hypothetical protein